MSTGLSNGEVTTGAMELPGRGVELGWERMKVRLQLVWVLEIQAGNRKQRGKVEARGKCRQNWGVRDKSMFKC